LNDLKGRAKKNAGRHVSATTLGPWRNSLNLLFFSFSTVSFLPSPVWSEIRTEDLALVYCMLWIWAIIAILPSSALWISSYQDKCRKDQIYWLSKQLMVLPQRWRGRRED
jgi:hypothetical protein